jgi:hypothetical protein
MRRPIAALVVLALLVIPVLASGQVFRSVRHARNFAYYKVTVLSGAVETVTVQQPASGAKSVHFQTVTLSTTAAVTFTLKYDGTAATGTAGTVLALSRDRAAGKATVWHTSDVGAGSTLHSYTMAADEEMSIDLSELSMLGNGTAKNVSIATDSVTATVEITFNWEER